jgi:hypothetical protein
MRREVRKMRTTVRVQNGTNPPQKSTPAIPITKQFFNYASLTEIRAHRVSGHGRR